MAQYIDKATVVADIEGKKRKISPNTDWHFDEYTKGYLDALKNIKTFLDTIEVKEDIKPKLLPSKKQLEALKDLLHYNIGVFDYQKCMEVNSLYENLIKVLDYETDR